jgi:hypothetical protein
MVIDKLVKENVLKIWLNKRAFLFSQEELLSRTVFGVRYCLKNVTAL